MRQALQRRFVAVLAIALTVGSVLSAAIFDYILTDTKKTELTTMASIFAELYEPEADSNAQANAFSGRHNDTRVTIIAMNGEVLGDSEADFTTMENHLSREEIQKAAASGQSVIIRTSSTLGRKLIYAVARTDSGGYVRVGQEYNGILRDVMAILPGLLLAGAIAFAVSGIFSAHMAQTVSRPIRLMSQGLDSVKNGGLRLDADQFPYEELQVMARDINELAQDVSTQIDRLQSEKARTDFLLDNIDEGFVLLDGEGNITLMNSAACETLRLNKGERGKLLSFVDQPSLKEALERAMETGADQAADMPSRGRIMRCRLTHVDGRGGMEHGMILTIIDVTAARRSMQMRQEFFSNASHELKTPITAIRGSAELLCSDFPLSDEQRRELLTCIGWETQRMNTLIQDIIMLSRIESGGISQDVEPQALENIVLECVGEAQPLASKNGVTIETHTQPIELEASRKNCYEVFGNLINNAVKYNVPGGRVELYLERTPGGISFRIRNDGEPIPPEQQERVFERFYRVDSGRSRSVGGTGLGLSIVKHIVDAASGTISLTSSGEEGTWVRIFLPNRDKIVSGESK